MKWLIQEFLNHNASVETMMEGLESEGRDFLFVRLNKDDSITVLDKKSRVPLDDGEEIFNAFIESGCVIGYGSKRFDATLRRMNVHPGSFMNERFEMSYIRERVGDELLNPEFLVGELQDLNPEWETFFIRPTGGTKLFGGMVVSRSDFQEWQDRENHTGSNYREQTLMMAPLKDIEAEYRFFVVDGKVVTGSSYRVAGKLDITHVPPVEVARHAQAMVDKFQIAQAFVIDIAETNEGMKIVEYNCFNTAGLYRCSPRDIIRAVERMTV